MSSRAAAVLHAAVAAVAAIAAIAVGGAGCTTEADPSFLDRGRGVWTAVPDAPPLVYRAVWGADARHVIAAGEGGAAELAGDAWRLLEGVPATTYRAVWGRSPSEVWLGGDGALLARSLTGWQAQALFDGAHEITDYSVLALGGDAVREYALVRTGGKLLLLVNRGSVWETPLWRGAAGPTRPLPQPPSLAVHGQRLLVGGGGDLVECFTSADLGVPMWEAHGWGYGAALPPVAAISGGDGFWVAAGAGDLVILRAGELEPELVGEGRALVRPRDVHGIFASRANRSFVVGAPVELARPDPVSGLSASPIDACDERGCALERVELADGGEGGGVTLRAVWGDADGAAIAVGDGLIVSRASCGGRRCRGP